MNGTTTSDRPGTKCLSHARNIGAKGFVVKLVLMCLVNAFGIYGMLAAWAQQSWWILGFLAVTLALANLIYFSPRAVPAKYLFPGLVFLTAFQLYIMGNTAYVAFTNYGDGHIDTKDAAITQILKSSDRRVENTPTYPVTVVRDGHDLGFAIVAEGRIKVGTATQPLADAVGVQTSGKITELNGWKILTMADILAAQNEVIALRVSLTDNPADGWLRTDNATFAYAATSILTYDEAADTLADAEGKVFKADSKLGSYVADDGQELKPGWRVVVGFDNFTKMLTDSRLSGPFLSILLWTFAFALLSVATTFLLGMFLAQVFNDPRVKGRRIYRSLLILPYAFPGFLAALVWKGMLNKEFGLINQVFLGGAHINWLGDGTLAKLSILGVNLWLGFPYMFLVCTGALQSIPGELTEAAIMDGANPWQRFWSITFPLLLVSAAPLLIASFAFNFNNFSLIYMLTGGGPNYVGSPILVGDTDILISMIYAVAFESGVKQYGLASAMSIVIFVLVGLVSWLGFRQTRKLEELV